MSRTGNDGHPRSLNITNSNRAFTLLKAPTSAFTFKKLLDTMLNERINTVIHKVGMLVRKDQKGQMVLNRSLQSTLRDSYPALVASVVLDTVGCTQAII